MGRAGVPATVGGGGRQPRHQAGVRARTHQGRGLAARTKAGAFGRDRLRVRRPRGGRPAEKIFIRF